MLLESRKWLVMGLIDVIDDGFNWGEINWEILTSDLRFQGHPSRHLLIIIGPHEGIMVVSAGPGQIETMFSNLNIFPGAVDELSCPY